MLRAKVPQETPGPRTATTTVATTPTTSGVGNTTDKTTSKDPKTTDKSKDGDANGSTSESAAATTTTTTAQVTLPDTVVPDTDVLPAIPPFQVNDNSRIDITLIEHEFEESMAKNDFSSQSTEASMYDNLVLWGLSNDLLTLVLEGLGDLLDSP